MYRCIIADDEQPARSRMKKLLASYSDKIKVIEEAKDGIDALEKAEDFRPDLIFLDIEMPGLNGIEVASQIREETKVVFITAYDEYAIKAFEANAIDYLVKPINAKRLAKTIDRIQNLMNTSQVQAISASLIQSEKPKRIAFKIGQKFEIFDTNQISTIHSQDQYSCCVIDGKEVLSDDSLERILSRLDPKTFIQVHRSHIINLDFLKELRREGDRKYVAILSDFHQTEIPVSREKLNELKKKLGLKQ